MQKGTFRFSIVNTMTPTTHKGDIDIVENQYVGMYVKKKLK